MKQAAAIESKGTTQLMDFVDCVLVVWAASFVLLSHSAGQRAWFPPAHALLLLAVVLLLRRIAFPPLSRPLQFLIAGVLSLACSSALVFAPAPNHWLRNWGIVVFLMWGWAWTRECVFRAFGLSSASPVVLGALRPFFLIPTVAGVLVALASLVLLEFSEKLTYQVGVMWLWLVPSVVSWLYLRRMPSSVALAYIEKPALWLDVFGKTKVVFLTVAMTSAIGLMFDLPSPRYLAWGAVVAILLTHALILDQVRRWASEASTGVSA